MGNISDVYGREAHAYVNFLLYILFFDGKVHETILFVSIFQDVYLFLEGEGVFLYKVTKDREP